MLKCRFCNGTLIEYAYHENGMRQPATIRRECVLCGTLEAEPPDPHQLTKAEPQGLKK